MELSLLDPKKQSEIKYEEIFNKTYNFLIKKNYKDLDEEIKLLETTLETLFTYSGNNWIGRGDSSDNRMAAQIAATETVLVELKELSKSAARGK